MLHSTFAKVVQKFFPSMGICFNAYIIQNSSYSVRECLILCKIINANISY